jgi:hypothetical protein
MNNIKKQLLADKLGETGYYLNICEGYEVVEFDDVNARLDHLHTAVKFLTKVVAGLVDELENGGQK